MPPGRPRRACPRRFHPFGVFPTCPAGRRPAAIRLEAPNRFPGPEFGHEPGRQDREAGAVPTLGGGRRMSAVTAYPHPRAERADGAARAVGGEGPAEVLAEGHQQVVEPDPVPPGENPDLLTWVP